MFNFTGLVGRGDNLRYKTDILAHGQIGKINIAVAKLIFVMEVDILMLDHILQYKYIY